MRPQSAQKKLGSIAGWGERAALAGYQSKPFVEAVAQECGVSAKSVHRFFQRHFKKSVQQQLDEFRIEEVERLAGAGHLAKQIFDVVGCRDAARLSHKFRNVRGICFRDWTRNA